MSSWDEIRTAYHVARVGTVSGAAEVLGVHHATVIRHIDALEESLQTKLFQRHARGYTPTEAGQELLRVARITDDQFTQMTGRIRGQGEEVSGELVITSLPTMARYLAPVLAEFQRLHPSVIVRFLTGERLFRLEYGEAHVAIRTGSPPQEADNVVQKFRPTRIGLYAHKSYVARNGQLQGEGDLPNHIFVGVDTAHARAPFFSWLDQRVSRDRIRFRFNNADDGMAAIEAGAGLGFMTETVAKKNPELIEQLPPRDEWASPNWIVTHVDLHRTPKVQAFLTFLKQAMKDLPDE
ncbi:LysR family transcriptional regulator [Falsihalocynthiibacter arcticus]|uniref:LysR family transcriptional regulator n=1 Tax=Falsihalocynthiibacter arcticus TaxID=1579316 RepID=A0A126V5E2_9RHOB|nr:LysR family transcriptional regulator [Falsihalocynthiibacter arcticus]AML53518.1 LysR family transcriptional regulator [Falsihalocynthiibacter arcticus]